MNLQSELDPCEYDNKAQEELIATARSVESAEKSVIDSTSAPNTERNQGKDVQLLEQSKRRYLLKKKMEKQLEKKCNKMLIFGTNYSSKRDNT